jgi:hypothetical protein
VSSVLTIAVLLDHHQLEELDISCPLGFMLTMFCRSSLLSAQFDHLFYLLNLITCAIP